jgi:ABC-type sugar transport system substrate-binding protein
MQSLYACMQQLRTTGSYHIFALAGDKVTPASIERSLGAFSFIDKHKDIRLDRFLYANWDEQEARSLTRSYLKWAKKNDIKPMGVWAANDPMALGAKAAMDEHGLTAGIDFCLVGLNWSNSALELVNTGAMSATNGGHYIAGAWAMVVLSDFETRKQTADDQIVGQITFEMQNIDASNIDYYIKRLRPQDWDSVDFSQFKLTPYQSYSDYSFSLDEVVSQLTFELSYRRTD